MTVINLLFNLPDEIKTIIWEYDPTYTIVKRDLCYYLRSMSSDFYSSRRDRHGLHRLIALAHGEDLPQNYVVSPSYVKESFIYTKQLWRSLGIEGPKTVKDIIQCSEADKECTDYLNLYIRSIHKINRPIKSLSQNLHPNRNILNIAPYDDIDVNDIDIVIKETSCTTTQAIVALRKNDYDVVDSIMELKINDLDEFPPLGS